MSKALVTGDIFFEEVIKAEDGSQRLPTFKMLANTGKVKMNLNGFWEPLVVDLQGVMFANKTLPILVDHTPSLRFGHSTELSVDDKGIHVAGVVSSSSPESQTIIADARNGFPFQASIGGDPLKIERVEAGKSVTVNGVKFDGPVLVSRKTVINEVSVVAIGGDNKTKTKVAATKGKVMDDFEKWVSPILAAMGQTLEGISAEQRAALQAQYDAQPIKATLVDEDAIKASNKLNADNTRRIAAIEAVAKRRANITLNPDYLKQNNLPENATVTSLQASAIEGNQTPDQFELLLIRAERPTVTTAIHVANRAIEAAPLEVAVLRGMCPAIQASATAVNGKKHGLEAMYDPQVLEASDAKQYRNASLHMLMDYTIQAAGSYYSGNRKCDDFIVAFFEANRTLKASAGYTNMAASTILENAAHKTLLEMYNAQAVTWPMWAGTIPVSDFKATNLYRLVSSGGYQPVGQTGELKHGSMTNSKYTAQADTYGKIVALSRKDMINDDLGAFAAIPRALGVDAALAIEELAFMQLLANRATLFTAGQGNYIEGASTDLGIDGLTLASAAFDNQVSDNAPLMLGGQLILVGTQDKVLATELYTKSELTANITSTTKLRPGGNPHLGLFKPVVSPYLNNTLVKQRVNNPGTAITNQDSNQWYMFASPSPEGVINVAFLNGNQSPTLEYSELDFTTLGMAFRSFHDFGVNSGDPKFGVWSKGAA